MTTPKATCRGCQCDGYWHSMFRCFQCAFWFHEACMADHLARTHNVGGNRVAAVRAARDRSNANDREPDPPHPAAVAEGGGETCAPGSCDGWRHAAAMSCDLTFAATARDAWREYAEHVEGCRDCGELSWEACDDARALREKATRADKLIDPGRGAESQRLRDLLAHPAPAATGEDAARLEAALPDLIGCCAKCGRRLTVILNVEHANPHYRIETLCQCGAELHLWRRAARAQEGR